MDSGSSVGELSGHIKPVTTISFKQSRPYRVASGSEDFHVNWYEGPPFKFKQKFSSHTRFVNSVRFSPNGNLLASAGSDKQLILYDGKTGQQVAAVTGHDGGIYGVSWSPDSSKILTASADKTCKIWDANTQQVITTFKFGNTVENQQLGCLWQGNYLLSVNLSGHITYLNENDASQPIRVLKGHNKFVTSLAVDRANNKVISGSYDATVTKWDIETGANDNFSGGVHTNQVTQLAIDGNTLISSGFDDSVRSANAAGLEYGANAVKTDAPTVGVASRNGVTVAVSLKSVFVIQNGNVAQTVAVNWDPQSVAINPAGNEVAVGGGDNNIHLYTLNGTSLTEKGVLEGHRGPVSCVNYAANGDLASGGKDRNVFVWRNGQNIINGWIFHAAVITDVAWSPNSERIASSSQDQHLIIWNVNDKSKYTLIRGAHRGGANRVAWADDNTVFSAGQDCTVKSWRID